MAAATPPTQSGSHLFQLTVRAGSPEFALDLGSDIDGRALQIQATPGEVLVMPVVSKLDLRIDDAVRVEMPNEVLSVDLVRSFVQPSWASELVRPIETPDVIHEQSRDSIRLADGWAPRELVEGRAVRWVGSEAHIEVDPNTSSSSLQISGIIGPCLGRGAIVEFLSGGNRVGSQSLDLEDGQRFGVKVNLGTLVDDRLILRVNRPKPRFTAHDLRVLNLLVQEVALR